MNLKNTIACMLLLLISTLCFSQIKDSTVTFRVRKQQADTIRIKAMDTLAIDNSDNLYIGKFRKEYIIISYDVRGNITYLEMPTYTARADAYMKNLVEQNRLYPPNIQNSNGVTQIIEFTIYFYKKSQLQRYK